MTDPTHILPIVAIMGLVAALVWMQRRLGRLENSETLRERQESLNQQMRRFSGVTMRLLGGEEAGVISAEVAAATASSTSYPRVAVALCKGLQGLELAGHAGLSPEDVAKYNVSLAEISIAQLQSYCNGAAQIGPQSCRLAANTFKISETLKWPAEETIAVFITSLRGTCLGVILLSGAKVGSALDAHAMIGIELLASHIALSIENASAKKRTFQSEKLEGMGQLVAGVAHELNNPLTAVLGYTEILSEKTNDPSVRYDLNVMRREALRMKRIIESLQQFSRKQRVEREKVDLQAIIENAIQSRSDEIREQKIEIVKQVDPLLPTIVANQALIDQVLQHVFANAMDAVHNAGLKRIMIEARAIGDQVHLQVSDSGPGFKDAGRVFDPFYTTKGPGKGTGLGLSLCYGIVRDHGGEITASNLHPLGACISIQLPLVSLEARSSSSPFAPAPVVR